MVINSVDFLWASSSTHKSDPEHLLEEFIRYTNVKISKLQMDAAGEFALSESFKLWCANRDIIMCPTAGYNHTMQARAENSVCITKEHIRCMLKHANMPYQYWPWALTQFCRIYNYWPSKGHAPPWVMLTDHRFSQSLHCNLHPFGCLIIGKLPREHPLVTNTVLSDRGLEGVFLGWDLSTPTVWMWSFRLRKAVCIHDPVFYDKRFPFADPSCLTESDDEDVEGLSLTPPTQPLETLVSPKAAKTHSPPPPLHLSISGLTTCSQALAFPDLVAPSGHAGRAESGETTRVQQPSESQRPATPDSAVLDILTDKQLGREIVLQVPADWWRDPNTGRLTACTVMATLCTKLAGQIYVDCQIVKPDNARRDGHILQLPVGSAKGCHPWHLRRLLDLRFNHPRTLADLQLPNAA
mmetsp:Transcript_60981/g.125700  ORF Transcript_60981/g.125700 Transcript_60981/m.125700 type:complete len:410 (+) Transcript_60981:404-1633(+)